MAEQETTELDNEEVAGDSAAQEDQQVDDQQDADATGDEQVADEDDSDDTEASEDDQSDESKEVVEEKPPKRRESLRIAKLVQQQLQRERAKESRVTPGLDYAKALDADPETIKALEDDRQSYAAAQREETLRQMDSLSWQTGLKIDAPRVEAKYPQLDANSKKFDKSVADALNQHYLNLVGYDPQTNTVQNPHIGYSDFVEAQYELANALATEKISRSTTNIARQAATTGLRPDGSSAKGMNLNKAPEAMSDEELDAVIAQTIRK